MRTIWAIYRADLRRARRSLIALVVIFGLIVIPSLFTWFNVAASWDPFGNTRSLRIAIANTDAGYKSDLVPLHINIGDQVVSALRKNDNFDWVIATEDDAIEGTRSGDYYAAIVIPEEFSEDMLTFFDGEASSAPMTYYVNEKKNGISPKLANQGAESVRAQVNQTFAQTLAEVALDTASSMGDALSSTTATGAVAMLDNRVQSVSMRLRTAADSADAYAALAGSSLTLIDSTTTLVSGVGTAKSSAQSAVGSADSGATGLTAAATGAIASISSAIDSSKTELDTLSTSVENVYSTASTGAADASASLRSQAGVLDSHATTYDDIKKTLMDMPGSPVSQSSLDTLQSTADRLRTLATNLRDAATDLDTKTSNAQTNHDNITTLIADAHQAVDDLSADYDNDLKPKLDSLASTLSSAQSSLSSARSSLSSSTSTASDGSDSAREKLTSLRDSLTSAASDMRDSAGKMDSLHKSIKEAQDSGDLTTLKDIIGNNPEALAAAIAAPVGVETIRVYPVANFGSQMAPIYTILALWVGSVLMAVSIRSDVSDDNVADGLAEDDPLRATLTASPIRLPAGYLGRYLIFGTIALAQATLLGLGDLYFLKVQHNHPLEFMGTLWLTAVVFSFLLYTLIATFGNAGKALGVLLLVLQISGAGGAFPLAILPPFFSSVSPFLPATHAITALRASIAGYSGHEYGDAMRFLASFILFAAFLGLALRPLLVRGNRRMVAKLESTKLL